MRLVLTLSLLCAQIYAADGADVVVFETKHPSRRAEELTPMAWQSRQTQK